MGRPAPENQTLPYVIEFNLGLASPPDTGYLSVVEAHTTSTLSSISGAVGLITTPGTATVTNYTASVADYYDPENVVTTGHFTAVPFGGDTAAADHNFAVQVQGTIQIATAGTYTFDVTSSDGFQLTIPGATFTGSSSGTTYSGNTMSYGSTPTTADSLGVTTLRPRVRTRSPSITSTALRTRRGWSSRRRPARKRASPQASI